MPTSLHRQVVLLLPRVVLSNLCPYTFCCFIQFWVCACAQIYNVYKLPWKQSPEFTAWCRLSCSPLEISRPPTTVWGKGHSHLPHCSCMMLSSFQGSWCNWKEVITFPHPPERTTLFGKSMFSLWDFVVAGRRSHGRWTDRWMEGLTPRSPSHIGQLSSWVWWSVNMSKVLSYCVSDSLCQRKLWQKTGQSQFVNSYESEVALREWAPLLHCIPPGTR